MSVIQIKNVHGDVWSLYPAVMVSKTTQYAVLREEMRRIFQSADFSAEMTAYRNRTVCFGSFTEQFTFRKTKTTYRMGCQSFDRTNTRVLRRWASA